MEGVRRVDEWNRIKEVLPNERVILDFSGSDLDYQDQLKESEMQIISLVNGQRSVKEICDRRTVPPFETYHALFTFLSAGLLMKVGENEQDCPEAEDTRLLNAGKLPGKSAGKKVLFLGGGFLVILTLFLAFFLKAPDKETSGEIEEAMNGTTEMKADPQLPENTIIEAQETPSLPSSIQETDNEKSEISDSDESQMNAVGLTEIPANDVKGEEPVTPEQPSPAVSTEPDPCQGKINLNTASLSRLMTLPRIGEKTAQAIIDYRTENGNFNRISEIMDIKGIGSKTFEKMVDMICVSQGTASRSKDTAPENEQIASPDEEPASSDDTKIDINTASTLDLQNLPRIGPKTAERIIEHRESQGPFRRIEDITKVKGIGPATFEQLEDLIKVSD